MAEHKGGRRPKSPRRSGRPPRAAAEKLRDEILDVATELFLKQGYGVTSIEAVARSARISKRTFYHRFADKADLFRAVVHRIIERLHPPAGEPLIGQGGLNENLQHLARLMLQGAMSPQGRALFRLVMAEAGRFPELAAIAVKQGGSGEAIAIVAGLLEQHARRNNLALPNPAFAAQQFLHMVVTVPQRRAMGLGPPMTPEELEAWSRNTVNLFLNGCFGSSRETPST